MESLVVGTKIAKVITVLRIRAEEDATRDPSLTLILTLSPRHLQTIIRTLTLHRTLTLARHITQHPVLILSQDHIAVLYQGVSLSRHPFPYRGGKNGGGPVNTVQVGETWTLTANGQLTDPYGNLLVTDGVDINAFESDVVSSERLSPYTCSLDSTSTPDTAVLDCTASPSSGATSSFVLCDDGRIAATEAACPDSVVDHFNHLILGPARAVQPPAQPPTAGTLSFIGDEPQLLGEVVYKGLPETAELLEVVTAGQTWTLSTDGHLVSPSGKVLVTLDGHTVADTSEDNSGHPYICTTSSQSTASKAILSCVAQIAQDDGGTSFYGSFVVCTNGEIQTEDPTCDYNDLYAFSQFTLTRV